VADELPRFIGREELVEITAHLRVKVDLAVRKGPGATHAVEQVEPIPAVSAGNRLAHIEQDDPLAREGKLVGCKDTGRAGTNYGYRRHFPSVSMHGRLAIQATQGPLSNTRLSWRKWSRSSSMIARSVAFCSGATQSASS